jgi:hypothetical protein
MSKSLGDNGDIDLAAPESDIVGNVYVIGA